MSEKSFVFVPRFRIPRLFTWDLAIKVGSLIFAIVAVSVFYRAYINPTVQDIELKSRVEARGTEGYVASREPAIIMKDPEQRWELTFWIWAMVLLAVKIRRVSVENKMLGLDYLGLRPDEAIHQQDALNRLGDIESALDESPTWRDRILPNTILCALHRFHATGSITDAAQSVKERTDVASNEYDADLSLIRFIAWAIPAIGFIGTVRGIGEALSQAGKAIAGDITGVVDALGLAFNSTLVALILSMPLMFLLYLVQGRQDKLFVDLQSYCDAHLIARMKAPEGEKKAIEGEKEPAALTV